MTSSVKKRPIRFTLLPSLLALSLALSACQDASLPTESDVQEGNQTSADATHDDGIDMNAGAVTDDTQMDKMSDEEKMIANLSRYRWTLMSVMDKGAQPLNMLTDIKDQVRLSFNQYQGENTLSYSVGCNTMSAGYQLQGHTLTIEEGMSTKMSCGKLDKAENSLSQLMQGESQLTLVKASSTGDGDAKDNNSNGDSLKSDKPILTQVTSDGATLIWEGRLTSQAKYNSKGEVIPPINKNTYK